MAKHLIQLVVGDNDGDGHEKTKSFQFESNLSSQELTNAHEKGSELIGFKLKNFCREYEDFKLPDWVVTKMVEFIQWEESDDFDAEMFADVYLQIAKLGNPAFAYESVKAESSIAVGGYGLFYC